ncbi:MAG: redox-regulated ATPase YchF [Candidatus Promineifilaceae bacterium]|nr:redox-regulated ATPase YchF [Candidatus Promineifilaceae bacterium]
MSLSIGIIGLPNVGKSTTFNALTEAQNAEVANYPFCTIEPNKAVVPVPDERLDLLHKLAGVPNKIYATIEFVDIAGLVKGASQGEGLGNQFLGNVRDADALIHVVRCFDDPHVIHINPQPEPRADIEIVATELILADLQQLENKIEKLERQVKGDKKIFGPLLKLALELRQHLEQGYPIQIYPERNSDLFMKFNKEMRFLSAKPIIFAANVDEASLDEENAYVREVEVVAAEQGAEVIRLCARLEEELVDLSAEEQDEYLELAGVEEAGLQQLIRKSYRMLNLISFFTMNENEVRAWTIRDGWKAPQAAGVIHTDFEQGFIRAEVISFAAFAKFGSTPAARAAGALRVEGREYKVVDGDVVYFRFNL